MKTLKINITGTVQGVFFRQFIKDKADELNLRGFVRNLDNSDVEVVIEGKDEIVNQFLHICRNGPPHSDVKEVQSREIEYQGFEDFKISRL